MPNQPRELYKALANLRGLLGDDFETLLAGVNATAQGVALLLEVLPELIAMYGSAAASIAADFYETIREDAQVPGRFTPVMLELPEFGVPGLLGNAAAKATTFETFKTLTLGGARKRVANAARDVITRSSFEDPASLGWMRIGRGECDFCSMLISRGAVYTESSVLFSSHDDCNCAATSVFDSRQIVDVRSEFVPSAKRRSEETKDVDRARVSAWIDANL